VFESKPLRKGKLINLLASKPECHGTASRKRTKARNYIIGVPGPRWAYAASWPLRRANSTVYRIFRRLVCWAWAGRTVNWLRHAASEIEPESSLLSIRHSRITSESFIPSAEEQQPHVRDV
jgi:hypothetical protein